MQAVILAGGNGSRLRSRLGDLPKSLVRIGGIPIIEHQIRLARRFGFRDIALLTGAGHEQIHAYIEQMHQPGSRLRCIREPKPLGTGGAVLTCIDQLCKRFLVMYGDTMLGVDLRRFWRAHLQRGASASLLLHPNSHPSDSDIVEIDSQSDILGFHPYPHKAGGDHHNLVSAALYVIERDALRGFEIDGGPVDFGRHLFPRMLARGCRLFGYVSPEYIADAGTPERLDSVEADYRRGRIAADGFSRPAPALFLDRDGTINREIGGVTHPDHFELLPGAAAAIRTANEIGWRIVVVTNQPVIAKGFCSEEQLRAIHNRMDTLLGREGAYVDAVYYCPHHADRGFTGERLELKVRCGCRKPRTGLIERARRRLDLDLQRSWLIGDSTLDIRTARNAGLRSVLVRTGHGAQSVDQADKPDAIADDLGSAIEVISKLSDGNGF